MGMADEVGEGDTINRIGAFVGKENKMMYHKHLRAFPAERPTLGKVLYPTISESIRGICVGKRLFSDMNMYCGD